MKIIILLFLICGFRYCSTECLAQPRPQKEEDSLGSDTSDPNGMWGSARIGWINSDLFAGKTMRQYYGGGFTYMKNHFIGGLHVMNVHQSEFNNVEIDLNYTEIGLRLGYSIEVINRLWLNLSVVPSYALYSDNSLSADGHVLLNRLAFPIEFGPQIRITSLVGLGVGAHFTPNGFQGTVPFYGFFADVRVGVMPD